MKGLVMSGGGSFGAFQVGCLQGIYERNNGKEYDFFSGVSVGALNATFLAQYSEFLDGLNALVGIWDGITSHRDVWRWTLLGPFQALVSTGLYNTSPLSRMIRDNLDVARLRASGNKLSIGAANVLNGEYVEVDEQIDNIHDWLMASTSFPGAFPSIQIGDQLYTDGGMRHVTPISSAIEAGCLEIDVLLTGPKDNISTVPLDKVNNVPELMPRILEMLFLSVWVNDLRVCDKMGTAKIEVYAPDSILPYDMLQYNPEEIANMMALGKNTQPIPLPQFLL